MSFAKNFLWGAASAATQVEGAYNEGGKGLSIWDVATKEQIKKGETCHVACDHFHKYKEDVALMKELGLKSYRFSVNWCRIFPEEGKFNAEGLEFYINLVKELKTAGIEPLCTLYHWDLPVWVQEKGGWQDEGIVRYFSEYVRKVVEALSEYVTYWFTLNEPQMFVLLGYMTGQHAPFLQDWNVFVPVTHNVLLAHWEAVRVIRKYAKLSPKIGIAMAASAYVPHDESDGEIERARKMSFEEGAGIFNNLWWMDPVIAKKSVEFMPGTASSQELIDKNFAPIDFVGLNIYQPSNYNGYMEASDPIPEDATFTSMDWIIDGRVLYWAPKFVYERYHLPVLISENGMADNDVIAGDGGVHDELRIRFIREYLTELKRAADEGIPILGYQHWSIMDNFEWAEGYGPRFGIVYVDYTTKKRVVKDSARYYSGIIHANGENL